MEKVLVTCSDFMWYSKSTENAFKKNGYDVRVCPSHLSFHKYQLILRLLFFLGKKTNKKDYERKKKKYNNKIKKIYDEFKPDYVYCILPNNIYRETLEHFKKRSLLIMSLSDTIGLYPDSIDNYDLFDVCFSYDLDNVNFLNSKGLKSFVIPGGYDPDYYYPIDVKKTIDVSFVGKMYDNRREILEKLSNDFPKLKMCFYGEYAPLRKPLQFLRWLFSNKKKTFKNRNIHYKKVNYIYNKSKIVLNIQCNQSKKGWSSRLPEISATKAFQIVDYNSFIDERLGDSIVMFKNYDELKFLIEYFLNSYDSLEKKRDAEYEAIKEYSIVKLIDKRMEIVKKLV